jgi:hypothetical protein
MARRAKKFTGLVVGFIIHPCNEVDVRRGFMHAQCHGLVCGDSPASARKAIATMQDPNGRIAKVKARLVVPNDDVDRGGLA